MSLGFNETAQQLLRAARENGGLTNESLFDLVVASHDESSKELKAVSKRLDAHCTLTNEAIASLTLAREKVVATQVPRIDRLEGEVASLGCIRDEHRETHAEHMQSHHRSYDPDGSDFSEKRAHLPIDDRRVWVLWGVSLFFAMLVASELVRFGLDKMFQ
jgi:hypothetical protein